MAALPSDHHIDEMFDRLVHYRAPETAAVLKAALARARRASSNTADGYPASTMSDGNGGAELTSVESAAQSRIAGKRRDPLDEHLRRCLAHLVSVVTSLDLLTVAVGNLSNVQFDAEEINKRKCWAMARVGAVDDFYRRIQIGDAGYDVGRFAWEFWRDTGQLPSIAQCRQKALGQRVMHKVEEHR